MAHDTEVAPYDTKILNYDLISNKNVNDTNRYFAHRIPKLKEFLKLTAHQIIFDC